MLQSATTFPHAGAPAFLRPTAEPVKIIQRNANGTCLISLTDKRFPREAASGNRTVDLAELAETAEEALPTTAKPRQRTRRGAR